MHPGWQAVKGRLLPTTGATPAELFSFDADAQGSGFTYGDVKTNREYVQGLEQRGNRLVWKVRASARARIQFAVSYRADLSKGTESPAFLLTYKGKTLISHRQRLGSKPTIVDLGDLKIDTDLSSLFLTFQGPAQGVQVFELTATPSQ